MNREELKKFLEDSLCPYCPWTTCDVSKPRVGSCEGAYCDEALNVYIDEENINVDD